MPTLIRRKYRFLHKTLSYTGWSLFWLLIWDIVVTFDFMLFVDDRMSLPSMPLTLLGSALAMLVSIRNTSAYNRWWEARTLWGGMVNSSRNFARQVLILVDDPGDALNPIKEVLFRRHVAYVNALAAHLKKAPIPERLAELLPAEEVARSGDTNNFPNDILSGSAALIAQEYKAGRLDSIRLARLESTMVDISNWQGGMERIANTPLPYPYVYFPRLFISLFCLIVPVGLVESLGWFTPLASTVVGFMLLALEKIGTDLQSPFSESQHQIQMTDLCANIEKNLSSMFRESENASVRSTE
ncbi:bestrophin family protein [Pseudomonas luteola]